MEQQKNGPPAELTHSVTGARMVLDTSQGSHVMRTRLERNVGIAEGGRQVLDKVREKEQEFGHIYVDPTTGYRARMKADGTDVTAGDERPTSDRNRQARGEAGDGADKNARREQLQRELAELDRQ